MGKSMLISHALTLWFTLCDHLPGEYILHAMCGAENKICMMMTKHTHTHTTCRNESDKVWTCERWLMNSLGECLATANRSKIRIFFIVCAVLLAVTTRCLYNTHTTYRRTCWNLYIDTYISSIVVRKPQVNSMLRERMNGRGARKCNANRFGFMSLLKVRFASSVVEIEIKLYCLSIQILTKCRQRSSVYRHENLWAV